MIRKWCITIAVILVLGTAVLAGVKGGQHAKAASGCQPLYLTDIGVWNTSFLVQTAFHRGQEVMLDANLDNTSGCATAYIAHPAVYHSSYRLLNVNVDYTSTNYREEPHWWVTIPKNAPLGTYKYWFTLSQWGYPDQTRMIAFKVIK